jgi:hypothetical protein
VPGRMEVHLRLFNPALSVYGPPSTDVKSPMRWTNRRPRGGPVPHPLKPGRPGKKDAHPPGLGQMASENLLDPSRAKPAGKKVTQPGLSRPMFWYRMWPGFEVG